MLYALIGHVKTTRFTGGYYLPYIQRSFFNVLMVNKTYPEHSLFLRLFAYNSGRAVVFLLNFASSSFEIRDEIFMHSFSKE